MTAQSSSRSASLLWHSASEASSAELATLRAEARHQAHEAESIRDRAVADAQAQQQAAALIEAELETTRAELVKIPRCARERATRSRRNRNSPPGGAASTGRGRPSASRGQK